MPVNMIAENGWQQSNNLVLGDNKYYAINNNTDATKLISPLLEVTDGETLGFDAARIFGTISFVEVYYSADRQNWTKLRTLSISATEGYWNKSDDINNCISRINEYLSLSGSGNYSALDIPTGDYRYYWTSSESSNEQAYAMYFDKDQIVIEIGPQFKQYGFGSSRVRAVLAF